MKKLLARLGPKAPCYYVQMMVVWLDATTANIVCQIYEALSPDRQEKFKDLPASKILDLCWRVTNGT